MSAFDKQSDAWTTEVAQGIRMSLLKAVRLHDLLACDDSGIEVRPVAAPCYPAGGALIVGARLQALLGLSDGWAPVRHHSLVLSIKNAAVFSSTGIVALASDEVIEDTLDHTDPSVDGYYRTRGQVLTSRDGYTRDEGGTIEIPAVTEVLPGRHLSLLLGCYTNHFHWLVMNFARLGLLQKDDFRVDSVLIPADLPVPYRDMIKRVRDLAGIALTPVNRGQGFRIETLCLPWNVASGSGVNAMAVSFLREVFADAAPLPKRRIYVDRRNAAARKLLNEEELIDALCRAGVEPIQLEDMSVLDQVALFCGAAVIVAPHGAGLANIAWARSGTRLIELMPSGVMNWCYRHLAAASGISYDCVIGRSQHVEGIPDFAADWVVSPTHVLSALSF